MKKISRRTFMKSSVAAGTALSLGCASENPETDDRSQPTPNPEPPPDGTVVDIQNPYPLKINSGGGFLWTTHFGKPASPNGDGKDGLDGSKLTKVEPDGRGWLWSEDAGHSPYDVVYADNFAWVTNYGPDHEHGGDTHPSHQDSNDDKPRCKIRKLDSDGVEIVDNDWPVRLPVGNPEDEWLYPTGIVHNNVGRRSFIWIALDTPQDTLAHDVAGKVVKLDAVNGDWIHHINLVDPKNPDRKGYNPVEMVSAEIKGEQYIWVSCTGPQGDLIPPNVEDPVKMPSQGKIAKIKISRDDPAADEVVWLKDVGVHPSGIEFGIIDDVPCIWVLTSWHNKRDGGKYSGGGVIRMDAEDGNYIWYPAFRETSGYSPFGIAYDDQRNSLWITNGSHFQQPDTVTQLEADTGELVKLIEVKSNPRGIVCHKSGSENQVWIASNSDLKVIQRVI